MTSLLDWVPQGTESRSSRAVCAEGLGCFVWFEDLLILGGLSTSS